jgi:hypothetical protein
MTMLMPDAPDVAVPFPEMTLPARAVVPPIVLPFDDTLRPFDRLPTPSVPVALVPMKLPCTVVDVVPLFRLTPVELLPEIQLGAGNARRCCCSSWFRRPS